jgi:hypothetical protein
MGILGRGMWLFLLLISGMALLMGFAGIAVVLEGGSKNQGAGELFVGGIIGFSACLWFQLVDYWGSRA